MEKFLKVRFPNGDLFEIPARIIAENRAEHYSIIDGYEKGSNEWDNEVQNALDGEFELEDWIQNNMDWKDLDPYAEQISGDPYDYTEKFQDAKIELDSEIR